jgi:hypothetical protein
VADSSRLVVVIALGIKGGKFKKFGMTKVPMAGCRAQRRKR